jgi:hypothetical protein
MFKVGKICGIILVSFFGASTDLRKATVSSVKSVCPSVSPSAWNNAAPRGADCHEISDLSVLENPSKEFKSH